VIALTRWPLAGIPPAPAGWIITTARHRALDRLRRESSRAEREHAAQLLMEGQTVEEHEVRDDHLRLIFICCHPALGPEAQLALTLRLLGGLTTQEIANAFLVPVATIAQRIARAKAKIRDAGIPYRIPATAELPARLNIVLMVVYLMFNEGYSASSGDQLIRPALCDEAIRLGRQLMDLLPEEPEVAGLLALMLLIDARRDARIVSGRFVKLAEQDRSRWNQARLEEGRYLLRLCLARDRPGPYQLQAAINAVHCDAQTHADTDRGQIVQLYDQLMVIAPSPVVALNRAVAVAEAEGAAQALALVDAINLPPYHVYHAVKADLLRRLGHSAAASVAYQQAIALCGNESERDFLRQQQQSLGD
jgi:RNA polymerase sigma-70 factor (ECF subfamily)